MALTPKTQPAEGAALLLLRWVLAPGVARPAAPAAPVPHKLSDTVLCGDVRFARHVVKSSAALESTSRPTPAGTLRAETTSTRIVRTSSLAESSTDIRR